MGSSFKGKATVSGPGGEPASGSIIPVREQETPAAGESASEQTFVDVPEGVDPASIPAKYHRGDGTVDWDALVRQHNYLESSQGAAPTDPVIPPAEGKGGEVEPMTPEAAYPFIAEYQRAGGLSETSYNLLQKNYGYTRAQVDQFIQGQVAQERVYYQSIADAVGGRETWGAISAWADQALTPDRLDFFVRQIHSGNPTVAVQAARSLKTEYESATGGVQGGLIQGRPTAGTSGVQPYASQQEKDAALHKKNEKGQLLVDVDPEYRRVHEQRHMAMLARGRR